MKYTVVGTTLRHNGKVYKEGSIVEMSPAKAKGCSYLVAVAEPDKGEKPNSTNSRRRGGNRRSRKKDEKPSSEKVDDTSEKDSGSDSEQESLDKED